MTPFGDGVEDAPGPVATVERSSVSAPYDRDTLLLQCEEYHKSGKGDSARERGGGDARMGRVVNEVRYNGEERARTSCTLTTSQDIAS